jgi:hypothetical protein
LLSCGLLEPNFLLLVARIKSFFNNICPLSGIPEVKEMVRDNMTPSQPTKMKATQIVIGEQEVFGSFNGLMITSRNLRHLRYFDV